LVLLGDGVDGIEDAGEVPEDGEQEADPELMLQEKKTRNQHRIRTFCCSPSRGLSIHVPAKKGKNLIFQLTPQPNLRKTPRGGRMMAMMMSMQVAVPMIGLLS
jgi:hypothetical protein